MTQAQNFVAPSRLNNCNLVNPFLPIHARNCRFCVISSVIAQFCMTTVRMTQPFPIVTSLSIWSFDLHLPFVNHVNHASQTPVSCFDLCLCFHRTCPVAHSKRQASSPCSIWFLYLCPSFTNFGIGVSCSTADPSTFYCPSQIARCTSGFKDGSLVLLGHAWLTLFPAKATVLLTKFLAGEWMNLCN